MLTLSIVNYLTCPKCDGKGKIPDPISLGGVMRNYRIKAGLTVTEVAIRMGYSKMYVSDLERGSRPFSMKTLEKFHAAIKTNNTKGTKHGTKTV